MQQFCEDVLKFLRSEYDDSYEFDIVLYRVMPNGLIHNNERAELTISFSPYYKLNITRDSMDYIFGWYLSGEYMGERNQYRWQKELIDMIEGS